MSSNKFLFYSKFSMHYEPKKNFNPMWSFPTPNELPIGTITLVTEMKIRGLGSKLPFSEKLKKAVLHHPRKREV